MAYQMRFLPPLQALMGLYANLATARVSLRRVSEILDVPIDVRDAAVAVRLPTVRGDIAFDNVTLSFDRGTPVLERLSFTVRAGEMLAIVGASGSGKSTIADLLLRLLDPDERRRPPRTATICDAVDLTDLRRHVALVDQEPVMLHASIAENIRYARPDASDAEVVTAAREAALESFVDGLPQRFETIVGERGDGAVGRRTAADRDRARVSRRSRRPRARRTDRVARSGVRTPGRRGLRARDARAHHDRDHPSPRSGAEGRSDHRARRGAHR